MTVRALAPVLFVVVGCTLDAGNGFATLQDARATLRFEAGERADGAMGFRTLSGHVVEVTSMSAELGELLLDARVSTGGGSGATFDPAAPPPGYSGCHGGHCHSDDGRLVPYEEIEAELSGGGSSSYSELVTMEADVELDLLAGTEHVFTEFLPSRELPEGTIGRARVVLHRFSMRGTVRGGPSALVDVPLDVDVVMEESIQTSNLGREVSLDADPVLRVSATVTVPALFLDEHDLDALAAEGAITITGGDDAAHLVEGILASRLEVTL